MTTCQISAMNGPWMEEQIYGLKLKEGARNVCLEKLGLAQAKPQFSVNLIDKTCILIQLFYSHIVQEDMILQVDHR